MRYLPLLLALLLVDLVGLLACSSSAVSVTDAYGTPSSVPTATVEPGVVAYFAARDTVESHLKVPTSAKWSNLYDDQSGCRELASSKWEAWGWVEAQNAFGVQLHSDWRVVLRDDGDHYRILYLKIGDIESGNYDAALMSLTPTP